MCLPIVLRICRELKPVRKKKEACRAGKKLGGRPGSLEVVEIQVY